jgi:hypothetical protein
MALWLEGFADLPDDVLQAALQKTLRTCKFWPVKIADVREHVETAEENGFALEAEGSWKKLLGWIKQNYYPGFGVRRSAPRLPAVVEHAARAAGGYAYIERCSMDELVWVRKTFLSAYRNVHETERVENLLSDSEAKRILAELKARGAVKRLVSRSTIPAEPGGEKTKPEDVQAVLNRVVEEKPIEAPAEAELECRRARLLRQVEERKETHATESEQIEATA